MSNANTEPAEPRDAGSSAPVTRSEVAAPEPTSHVLSDGALFPPVTPDPPPPPGYVDPVPGLAEADVQVPQDPEDQL